MDAVDHDEAEDRRSGQDRRSSWWSPAAERRRLAAQLHDEVLQALLTARQDLDAARDGTAAAIVGAGHALDEAIARLRRLIGDGPPPGTSLASLHQALETFAAAVTRPGGPRVSVDVDTTLVDAAAHRDLLFRCAREFLLNALKHAAATRIDVAVAVLPEAIRLTVTDDGRGFAPPRSADRGGPVGLVLARDRVRRAGGRLTIEAAAGGGTCVLVDVPRG